MYLHGRFDTRLLTTIRILIPLVLGLSNFSESARAASVTLAWDASASPDVAGYNIYYGGSSQQYTNSISFPNITTATILDLPDSATFYIAATAFDSTGAESDFSNEAVVTNPPPDITISHIGTQTIQLNTVAGPIAFTVSDLHGDASLVNIVATSSNTSLISDGAIVLGGSDSGRTITLTPAQDQTGTAVITLTADDGVYTNAFSFNLIVKLPNRPPTITSIADQQVYEDSSTTALPFSISDAETPVNALAVTASSSNGGLFPAGAISLAGSGSVRTVTVTPPQGLTGQGTVTITVSDGEDNATATFAVNVVAPILTVSTNGDGFVTPALTAGRMKIGQKYTLSATPAKGQVFVGWTGTTNSTSSKLSFVFNRSYSLQASFVPSPYAEAAGQYTGLFYEDAAVNHESSGIATITVSSRGTFSAKLQNAGKKSSLSGVLTPDLETSNVITRGISAPLSVWLRFGTNNEIGQLFGTISSTNWKALLHAERSAFNQKTNPAPFAGRYTIVFPGVSQSIDSPAGDGYGTLNVSSDGRVAFAGTLADGVKATQTGIVFSDSSWPFYCNLYGGNGSALGWFSFTAQSSDDVEGTLNWIRKPSATTHFYLNGFTNEVPAYGSFFNSPAKTAAPLSITIGEIAFTGGNLTGTFTNLVAITGSKAENQSTNKLSLSLSASTGLFHGSVQDPFTGENHTFGGAVIQKQNMGFGFLLGTNASSGVLFLP